MKTGLVPTTIFLRDTVRRVLFYLLALFPPYRPLRGITIVAFMSDGASLSKVMRDFARSLEDVGIPFQVWDLCRHTNVPSEELKGIITPWWKFRPRKYSHVIEMFESPFPDFRNQSRSTVLFWEFESGFPEVTPHALKHPSVIGMSDFNVGYFGKVMPKGTKVRKILYPFRMEHDIARSDAVRHKYGIGENDFIVFFNFDFSSGMARKNPEGAMTAFALAFAEKEEVKLVFKTMHAGRHGDAVKSLQAKAVKLGIENQFVMIHDYLSQRDLYALVNACDCYLSLHRGEGFGLGIAEAMSLAKPVVVSDYSATTEFCRPDHSFPIPCELVEVPSDERKGVLAHVSKWAEPDVKAAVRALRALYESPGLRRNIGAKARTFMLDYFSPRNFRRSIEEFLDG